MIALTFYEWAAVALVIWGLVRLFSRRLDEIERRILQIHADFRSQVEDAAQRERGGWPNFAVGEIVRWRRSPYLSPGIVSSEPFEVGPDGYKSWKIRVLFLFGQGEKEIWANAVFKETNNSEIEKWEPKLSAALETLQGRQRSSETTAGIAKGVSG